MTGANGFLKKNECTVVWAAFRDRNFEVGLPKAMSVPSKLQHCHSTLGHSPHICKKNRLQRAIFLCRGYSVSVKAGDFCNEYLIYSFAEHAEIIVFRIGTKLWGYPLTNLLVTMLDIVLPIASAVRPKIQPLNTLLAQ